MIDGPRRRAEVIDDEGVGADSEPEEEQFDDDEAENEFLVRRVPLRCGMSRFKRNGEEAEAKCAGCQKRVRDSDIDATRCDMRNSWWHKECVQKLIGKRGCKRAVDPAQVAEEEKWLCPQCLHHLCFADSHTKELCIFCGKPSVRSGRIGDDMVSCDGEAHGLFRRHCVGYVEAEEEEQRHEAWYCPTCTLLPDNDDEEERGEEMERIEEHICHENSVPGVLAAIDQALGKLSRDAFERGFESRRV